jgi:hypothetical protein
MASMLLYGRLMKKATSIRKLALDVQTIKLLDARRLEAVAGGDGISAGPTFSCLPSTKR